MTNHEFSEKDTKFIEDCKEAKVPPTKRQASKYRNGFGKAKGQDRLGRPIRD